MICAETGLTKCQLATGAGPVNSVAHNQHSGDLLVTTGERDFSIKSKCDQLNKVSRLANRPDIQLFDISDNEDDILDIKESNAQIDEQSLSAKYTESLLITLKR